MESLDNQIVVSIQCLTYNHAPYIRQCLDGFVMQKTNFRFEAIVHDDASTDGTQDIIREYEKKYPDIIKPIYQKENQYSKGIPGFITNLVSGKCKGKYIAICEGDDYWTDPYKLQKQVDYLESHPECGMVYTQVNLYDQGKSIYRKGWAAQTDFEDLLLNSNKIITLATCFRRDLYDAYHTEVVADKNWKMVDFPLWLYISHHSSLKYFDETTGVYRLLPTSASHNPEIKKMMDFLVSTYEVRCFFAKKYGREDLLDTFAANEVNNLFRLSVQKDKNISGFIYRFAKNHGVVSISTLVKCLLYSTKVGRSFHRKKYPSDR